MTGMTSIEKVAQEKLELEQKEFLSLHLGDNDDGRILRQLAFHNHENISLAIKLLLLQQPDLILEYEKILKGW